MNERTEWERLGDFIMQVLFWIAFIVAIIYVVRSLCIMFVAVIEIFASIGVVKIAKYEEDPLWGVAVFPVFRSMNITKIAFGTYYIGLVMMVDFLLGSACLSINERYGPQCANILYIIAAICFFIYYVMSCICLHRVVKKYRKKAVGYTIFNIILLNIPSGFIYFYLANKIGRKKLLDSPLTS